MTITVDCRWLDSSGVGVYIRECLPFFLDSSHSFLLLGNSEKLSAFTADKKNVEVLDCPIKPFSFGELFAFPASLRKKINSSDLYYTPFFNIPGFIKVPIFTTIHDIIFPDMPELTSRFGLAVRMWFYRRAFRRSRKIFTVSEFSKSRIEYYSKNKVPVIVTHSAIQPAFLNSVPQTKKNIILFIGNIKKHKGLSILTEAFLEARREGLNYKLLIAGSKDNFRSKDNTLELSENKDAVEFTGFLSDEMLRKLIAEASLLVQPSLYEGFCLPPLEALVSGTPALISDIPVLKEVYTEYPQKKTGRTFPVYWFKAGDSKDLKEKLVSLLSNKKISALNLPAELKNLYTFEKTSSAILRCLEER